MGPQAWGSFRRDGIHARPRVARHADSGRTVQRRARALGTVSIEREPTFSRGIACPASEPYHGALGGTFVKIEHAAYQVEDPLRLRQWYVEHLGLTVKRAEGEPAF